MATATDITTIITIVKHTCGKCGVVFGLSSDFKNQRLKDHEAFYCPNGHPRAFTSPSEADRLRDDLARERHWREQADARNSDLRREVERERRRTNGYKGAMKRVSNRVAKGVCPCCSTKFKDLKTHMQTEHPDWNPDKHADALAAKP